MNPYKALWLRLVRWLRSKSQYVVALEADNVKLRVECAKLEVELGQARRTNGTRSRLTASDIETLHDRDAFAAFALGAVMHFGKPVSVQVPFMAAMKATPRVEVVNDNTRGADVVVWLDPAPNAGGLPDWYGAEHVALEPCWMRCEPCWVKKDNVEVKP